MRVFLIEEKGVLGYVFIMVLVRVSKGKEGYLDIKFMVLFCVRGRLDSWGLEDGYLYTFLLGGGRRGGEGRGIVYMGVS